MISCVTHAAMPELEIVPLTPEEDAQLLYRIGREVAEGNYRLTLPPL